jgi:hypothetical protein
MANKLLSAEPSSTFLSSALMIGQPGINCCPILDNLGKKGAWVVLAVFYARSNSGPGRRRDAASVVSVAPYPGILRARTMNPLGAEPTKLNG